MTSNIKLYAWRDQGHGYLGEANIKLYEVGGCVRDRLLGIKNIKDIDYSAVSPDGWEALLEWCKTHMDVKQVTEKCYTIRGRLEGRFVDVTMARKDGKYTDGRRPDSVTPGTLHEDLARRDFTMNAIAVTAPGTGRAYKVIDPFNGQEDIKYRIIRCVGDPLQRFEEDYLRIMRALRFSITKGMKLHHTIEEALTWTCLHEGLADTAKERRREELAPMFSADTLGTMRLLQKLPPALVSAMFAGGIWLEPTLKRA